METKIVDDPKIKELMDEQKPRLADIAELVSIVNEIDKGVKKVWGVDSGAYENYSVGWLFESKEEADKCAAHMNAIGEAKGQSRSEDSYYDVQPYQFAKYSDIALLEDERLDRLHEDDIEARKKEFD